MTYIAKAKFSNISTTFKQKKKILPVVITNLKSMTKTDEGYEWTKDPRKKHLTNEALEVIMNEARHLNTVIAARWRIVFNDVIGDGKTWKQIAEENRKTDIAILTMLRPDDEAAPKHEFKTRQSLGDLYFWYKYQGFSKSDILYIVTGERRTEKQKELEIENSKLKEEIEIKESTIRMMAKNE